MANNPAPVVFDEVQRTKSLFLQLKAIIDETKPPIGSYILTGSQPFLLMRGVSESLAGRIGMVELLPMTVSEVRGSGFSARRVDHLLATPPIGSHYVLPYVPNELLIRGFFPAMALKELSPTESDAAQRLVDYIQTYLTKDLRDLSMLKDLAGYERFLRHLALYAAQPINVSEMGGAIGLKQSTVSEWLSLTEAAYIYRRIPGFHHKLGRRESKRPKGLFVDSGLTASLLGYQNSLQLAASPLLGRIFESVAIHLVSQTLAEDCKLHHWRVDESREVDLIIEVNHNELVPVEIKMTAKPTAEDCEGIYHFMSTYKQASK